jgi:hypothetical protein
MPRKRTALEKLARYLPKWKNNEAGKCVYLYALSWVGQLLSLTLPYWKIYELVDACEKPADCETNVCSEVKDNKLCEHQIKVFGYEEGFYQEESFCAFIKFCIFWAMVIDMVCMVFALKAAKKPSRKDQKVQSKVSILGFFGFLFGILSMAMFSPGEKGDIAAIGVGFVGQMFGLLLMLGGVIVQFEAGSKENIDPKLRFQMFGGGGPTRVSPA